VIEEDDEFAHDGDERDFLGLTSSDDASVEGFQDGIETCSYEGGHIKDAAHFQATASDDTASAVLAAVVVIRCDSG